MELLIVIYAAKFHLKHAGNFKVSLEIWKISQKLLINTWNLFCRLHKTFHYTHIFPKKTQTINFKFEMKFPAWSIIGSATQQLHRRASRRIHNDGSFLMRLLIIFNELSLPEIKMKGKHESELFGEWSIYIYTLPGSPSLLYCRRF